MMLKVTLGNISKVNETFNFIATYDNRLEKQSNTIWPIPSPDSHNNITIRSRCITIDIVHLMSKNKTRRRKIKRFIKQLFLNHRLNWHNLLSTRFRKYVSQKPTNVNMWWQFIKPCRAIKKIQNF